ncbi:MAG TPA: DUF1343 domain-containing protein [Pyrinomonadaceae bacterium]|nr:DUF1343 domain-containing protein [Pyrinomonadaceae bacterium]
MNKTRVRPGIEVLIEDQVDKLEGQRIGLVCNQATVLPSLRYAADVFHQHPQINLTTLFGPQHGIRGDVQDNMVETDHSVDGETGLPIYSLYSETREPTAEMLSEVDTVVFDLQDVGCRIYTFVYTMANCMRAARRHGKKVIVCDRPNPIGGLKVEGNVLEAEFSSFVGQFEITTRHGMTTGELALLFNEYFGIGCDLEIIKMQGWKREMWYDDTGLPWVMPSPNMPTLDTATVFPGSVHLEGTELSEGRGTTRPFEICGAPFIDPYQWKAALDAYNFEGVYFRPLYFMPTFQKWGSRACGGVQVHVTDREKYEPVKVGIAMVKTAFDMYESHFQWKQGAYEYVFDKNPFDVVCGTDKIRKQIENQAKLQEITEDWESGLTEFNKIRKDFLLY